MDLKNLFKTPKDEAFYTAGTTIFEQGTQGNEMFVVLEGEIEIKRGNQTLDINREGDLVGEMAIIDQSPRSATAVAKTDCRLAKIDQRRFLFLVQETPFFALQVMGILAQRLRKFHV